MKLRSGSALRTPQRYDDADYQDRHQNEVRQHTVESEASDVYRGPVIEFNPNLRPAVFPTIPLDQEVDESLFTASEVSQNAPAQRATKPSQPDVESGYQSDTSSHTLRFSPSSDPEMFAFTSTDDRWSRELNKEVNTSPLGPSSPKMLPKTTVGTGSKVWNENMKKLDALATRTETDWNIAEMETSEEDEAEESKAQAQHNPKDFAWDCLAVVQRLCIVDAVDESYDCLNTTFKLLRLTPKQKDQTIALIAQRNEYIDAEETALQMVRDRASEILRSGNQEDIDWLTKKGGYGQLMKDNAYIGTQHFDYMTTTSGELQLAKRYLVTCGLKPELLDHWASVDTLDLGNASTSTGSTTAPRSEPRAAAFPTIPLGQVYGAQHDNGDPSVSLEQEPVPGTPEQGLLSGLSLTQQEGEEPITSKKIKLSVNNNPNAKAALPARGRRPPAAMFSTQKRSSEKTTSRRQMHALDKDKADQGYDGDVFERERMEADQGLLQQHDTDTLSRDKNHAEQEMVREEDGDCLMD